MSGIKRSALFLIVLFCTVISLFADNLQKTYTVDDEIYKRVDRLTREAGVIGPSSFSPMSGRVLQIALNRIDTTKLSPSQLNEYNYLYNEITKDQENHTIFYSDNFGLDIGLGVNLTFNIEDYEKFDYSNQKIDHRNDNMIPYRYQDAFLTLYPKIYFGDYVFLEGKFEIKNNNRRNYESSLGWLMTRANNQFSLLGNGYPNTFAPEMPYKAGASIGNDYFSFILGRYPHSIGSGITGNLLVGDNFMYQEISNLSLISNYFTYNISITRFDQMDNIGDGYGTMSRCEFDGMQQFRVAHRFDVNLFNKVRFAMDLATIYNSHYGFDMRFFYPFVISHNYYNYTNYLDKQVFDEANNIMNFYLEVAPMKGLSLSAQVIIDQMQVYFEEQDSIPSAWGVLANLKHSTSIGKNEEKGNLDTWFEFVYTNPYLYLNGKKTNEELDYNLDYIVGYHTKHVQDYGYSGYQFGPDTILFALGTEYNSNKNWNVGIKTIYRVWGGKRLGNNYVNINKSNIDMSDSTIEGDSNIYMNAVTPTGGWCNAEHLFQPVIYGKYIFDYYNLELCASAAFSTYFNYNFNKGEPAFLPQFSIGLKWTGINNNWFK